MKRIFLSLAIGLLASPASADLFTDHEQAKPVLEMIKPDWIAVREFNGQDFLYFSTLLTYRCAISQIRFSYNNGPLSVWEPEPCYWDEKTPYAMKLETHLPYAVAPLGSLQTITVNLLFEDGSTLANSYMRKEIQIN